MGFQSLKLKALICPEQARWPSPDVQLALKGIVWTAKGLHWEKLHASADEARDRVAKAWAEMDEIDRDRDLSFEGKVRRKRRLAAEGIADFEKSRALAEAKKVSERQLAKWNEQSGLTIKPAANIHEAAVYSKIWDKFDALKGASRMAWLQKHGDDPIVASALLTAPACVSGMSDTEIAFLRKKIEQHVCPGIAKPEMPR